MSVGTSAAIAIAAGASAGGAITAAKLTSGAAKTAAADQTSSANHAADAQSASNAATLDFQKQQAAADAARQDAAQRANYAQYLTHYNAVKGLGSSMGMDLPDAPSYDSAYGSPSGSTPPASPGTTTTPGATTPGSTPILASTTTTPGATTTTPGTAPAYTGAPTDRAAITSWVQSLGKLPGADPSLANDPTYWAGRIIDTGGLTSANTDYWYKAGVGPTAFVNNPGRESKSASTTSGVLPSSISSYLPGGTGLGAATAPALQRPAVFRIGPGASPYSGSGGA